MTRVLAELLGAEQPRFGMTIRELERAAGMPSHDIKLSSEIMQRVQAKLRLLGLDPHNTTDRELYIALIERLKRDEVLVREALGVRTDTSPSTADILLAVKQFFSAAELNHKTFALKSSVAKRLLKKHPPKRTMKQLHYRSLDSMLKHEPVSQVYVAAFLCESLAWRKKFLDQYNSLQPSDFETRAIQVLVPTTARWEELAERATEAHHHNVIVVKELGAVVLLPLPVVLPGIAITSFVLLVYALNDIASSGSYLKLQQVKPDFGRLLRGAIDGEPMTSATLAHRQVPWRVVHQYYARFKHAYNPAIFEPHIEATDLQWLHPEALLGKLHDALDFWHDTRYTAHHAGESLVSLNIFDVAVAYCNRLEFAERSIVFMRQHLWQELMVRYLNHRNVEQAIVGELALQPEFVPIDADFQ